jgi:hypothetical protein
MTKLRYIRNLFSEPVTGTEINSTEPFYQLYGEVRVENTPGSGVYEKSIDFLLDPLEDLQNEFVLNAGFRGRFLPPFFNPYSISTMQKVNYNILKGKFYGAEYFGSPPVVGMMDEIEDFVVINGGISTALGFDAGNFRLMNAPQKFLTWHPRIKMINRSQPEILHYLVYRDDITSLQVKVRITYTDQTDITIDKYTIDTDQWDLIRIPVGYDALQLAIVDPSKAISEYDVWLEDTAGPVSEERTYEVDFDFHPWERLWIYENSLGMPEVFRTIGKTSYANTFRNETAKRALVYNTNQNTPRFFSNQITRRISEEISTGFLRDLDTARYMVDFLITRGTLYEVKTDSLIPFQLTASGTYPENTDGEYNYFLRFTVAGAFEDESYTG